MRVRSAKRHGVVLVLVALCLIGLLGAAAMAVDAGLLMDQRRRAQAAADAGALAAAIDLYLNYPTNNGLDPNGTAKASATAITHENAQNNLWKLGDYTLAVNIPPGSGNFAGKAGYAEVVVQYNQPPGFSRIFGSGNTAITARAVAAGLLQPLSAGMIILDPASQGSLSIVGNATIDLTSGPINVDSTNPGGATFTGNASITAPTLDLSGDPGYSTSGGNVSLNTSIQSNQPPIADPLAWLPAPNPSSLPVAGNNLKISGKNPVTLNPGVYMGGISISGQANVTLNPGIYYMEGGGFSVTGNSSSMVTGNGVMIYDDGGGPIKIAGQGTVTLSPPTSGIYAGITLFLSRSSSQSIQVSGNGSLTKITGTFYAASGTLTVVGNGSTSGGNNGNLGSQYISYDATLTGNGTIDTTLESAPRPWVRVFALVE